MLFFLLGFAIPKGRITELDNLRRVKTKRYVTHKADITLGLSRIDGLDEEEVWEPACGEKTIIKEVQRKYPRIKATTFDIDAAVEPDVVCDYSDPSKYKELKRPDFIIFR